MGCNVIYILVCGLLKGFDPLQNIVLDDCIEYLRSMEDATVLTGETRDLGLVCCRGPAIVYIAPFEGTAPIANPFDE